MAILVKRGSYSDNFVSEGVGIQFYCSNFSLIKLIIQSNKTLAKKRFYLRTQFFLWNTERENISDGDAWPFKGGLIPEKHCF